MATLIKICSILLLTTGIIACSKVVEYQETQITNKKEMTKTIETVEQIEKSNFEQLEEIDKIKENN